MKKITAFILPFLASVVLYAQTEVTFYTTEGVFVAEIHDDIMPITGGNFLDLVDAKFYDGVIFHRVIDGFVIQGGDPTGTGSGGPGYTIQDEFHASLSNIQASIAMANAGPNTGGSQFFINLVPNTFLDSKHPVFGQVLMNFSVVQTIGKVSVDGNDRPLVDVVMDSVRVGNGLTVGVNSVPSSAQKLTIYPNPVSKSSIIQFDAVESGSMQLAIYDAIGRMVFSRTIEIKNGENRFNASDFLGAYNGKGIHQVLIFDERQVLELKFLLE